jgi:hypothetical protein
MDIDNAQVPVKMISFEKAKKAQDKRQYVHFYMHDKFFSRVLTATNKYINLLKTFDGVMNVAFYIVFLVFQNIRL